MMELSHYDVKYQKIFPWQRGIKPGIHAFKKKDLNFLLIPAVEFI